MKVRLLTTRWDQPTAKGKVRRFKGDAFSVKDDVAEWLIASGAAEATGRAPASRPAPEPAESEDVTADLDDDDESEPEVGGDEPADEAVKEDDDADGLGGVERPAQSAPKADWVAYAVSRGVPAKEAEAMDKPKLISRAG